MKRYDWGGDDFDMVDDGEWVRHADAQAALEAVTKERDEALATVSQQAGRLGTYAMAAIDLRAALNLPADATAEAMVKRSRDLEAFRAAAKPVLEWMRDTTCLQGTVRHKEIDGLIALYPKEAADDQ